MNIHRILNQLIQSNCYVVFDDDSSTCVLIDPAEQYSERLLVYLERKKLTPAYILLTHEHADHTWGVNHLLTLFPDVQIVCTQACADRLPFDSGLAFTKYRTRLPANYKYHVERVDIIVDKQQFQLVYKNHLFRFYPIPGHALSSTLIALDNHFFTGDSFLRFPPVIDRRRSTKQMYRKALCRIDDLAKAAIQQAGVVWIYPGHGNHFEYSTYPTSEVVL